MSCTSLEHILLCLRKDWKIVTASKSLELQLFAEERAHAHMKMKMVLLKELVVTSRVLPSIKSTCGICCVSNSCLRISLMLSLGTFVVLDNSSLNFF